MKQILATLFIATALTACDSTTTTTETAPQELIMTSTQSFSATENRLRDALMDRKLKLFAVIDHGKGAQSIGEDIGQSKLFIFGNPKSGTPLIMAEPKLALELPMKILIHEVDGEVHLHRTDIIATVRNYGVINQDKRLAKIDETLSAIIKEAAAN